MAVWIRMNSEDIFLIKLLILWLNVDSLAIVRENTERWPVPFTQFPPMVTSCKTVSQDQNEEGTSEAISKLSCFPVSADKTLTS